MAQVEFGVLWEHVTPEVHDDLVGPTWDEVGGATDALLAGRVQGFTGTVVQREDDGPWRDLHTGQEALEWLREAQAPSSP